MTSSTDVKSVSTHQWGGDMVTTWLRIGDKLKNMICSKASVPVVADKDVSNPKENGYI